MTDHESTMQETSELYVEYKKIEKEKHTSDHDEMYTEVKLKELVHAPVNTDAPIVVTGFGPIYPPYSKPNLSATIMQTFYFHHGGYFKYGFESIPIVTDPPGDPQTAPVSTLYRYVKEPHFDDWLRLSDARLYVHLGILTNNEHNTNPVYLEKQAYNFPVNPKTKEPEQWARDFERNNNDGEPCFPDGDNSLVTDFDIPELRRRIEEKTVNWPFSFRESDNPGNFLCNFLYYRSLYYAKKRNDSANVLLIHVPDTLVRGVTIHDMVWVLGHVIRDLLDMQNQSKRAENRAQVVYADVVHHKKTQTAAQVEYTEIRDEVQIAAVDAQTEIAHDQDHNPEATYYAEITNDMELLTVNEEQLKLQKLK